ncbi:MAG: hypothetical protein ACI828_000517 [Flavobacteriales bacterium]|jgi:hypothetical protein
MFINIILGTEILAAIVGVLCFYKYRNTPLKPWIILLFLAPLAEIIGNWYSNHIIFNIYVSIHQLILLKIIFDFIIHPLRKKLILWIMGASVIVFLINCTYVSVVTDFLSLHESTDTALIIIALSLYLVDRLNSDTVLEFRENLPVIVFSGYIILNIVYLPILFTFQYLVRMKTGFDTIYPVLNSVKGGTNILTNVLFRVGLLWSHAHLKHKQA